MTQIRSIILPAFGLTTLHSLEDLVAVEREIEPQMKLLDFAEADKAAQISASFFAIDAGLALVRDQTYSAIRAMKSADRLLFSGPNLSRPETMAEIGTKVVGILDEMTKCRSGVWKNKLGLVLLDNHYARLEATLSEPVLDALLALWSGGPLAAALPEEQVARQIDVASAGLLLEGFANALKEIIEDKDAGDVEFRKRVKFVEKKMRETIDRLR